MNSGVKAEASSLRLGVVESVLRRRADAWRLQSEASDSAAGNELSQNVASSVGSWPSTLAAVVAVAVAAAWWLQWIEPRGTDCSEPGARRALLFQSDPPQVLRSRRSAAPSRERCSGVVLLLLPLLSLGQALVHTLLNECPDVQN